MTAFPLKADISQCLILGEFRPLDFDVLERKGVKKTLGNQASFKDL